MDDSYSKVRSDPGHLAVTFEGPRSETR